MNKIVNKVFIKFNYCYSQDLLTILLKYIYLYNDTNK